MSDGDLHGRMTPPVAYTMLVFVMAMWASGVVAARSVHALVPPIGFSFWRWVCVALALTPFAGAALVRNRGYVLRRAGYFVLLGVFMAGGSTLLVWSVQYTTATNASLVSATQPIVTGIVAWLIIKERLSARQMAGVLCALGGVVAMIARMDPDVLLSLSVNPGDVLVLVAVVFYALYSVNLHRWVQGLGPLLMMYMTALGGALVIAPFYAAETLLVAPVVPDPRVLAAIVYMGLVPSLVAVTMWNVSVGIVGANRASVFLNLVPVFGTALAVVLLGEVLRGYHLVGGAFVCAGITLVVVRPRTRDGLRGAAGARGGRHAGDEQAGDDDRESGDAAPAERLAEHERDDRERQKR